MAKLTGTNPDQVPTNADLGDMAYKDGDNLQAGPLTITDGKVGIGTQSPDEPLHIVGGGAGVQKAIIENTSSGQAGLDLKNNAGHIRMIADNGGWRVYDQTDGANRIVIDTSGKVGIGVTSPAVAFHVDDNSSGEQARISSSSTNGATLGFRSTSTNGRNYRIGSNFVTGQGEFSIHDDTAGTVRMTISQTGEVQIASGKLELDGNDIGGTQVTIADDAVASITPPRNGGFMFVTCQGDGTFPQQTYSGSLFYDVGSSLLVQKHTMDGFVSSDFETSTSDVTGTTGTDGKVTIAVQTGVIKIENRTNGPANFQITFL